VNGVYGSILTAFPEQFADVLYFDMAPLASSGWGPRTDKKKIRATVVQCTTGRKVKDSNGNLVISRDMELWSEELLQAGRFVEFEEDGAFAVYRISGDNEWRREAGFVVYSLAKVVAADGTEGADPAFSNGTGAFA
jgi:hypothetical protein